MRKYLLLLPLFLFTCSLYGQIDTTKVPFVAYWSIGDSYDFKVTKTSQQWKEGVQIKDEEQTYIANFTVLDSTETSYTVSWSYENDLSNSYQIPEELLEKFSKYNLTEIRYKTSELGEFIEILNWEEVAEIMNNMFDDITAVLGEKDENKKKSLKTSLQPLKQMLSSKKGIEELLVKELQFFHFPMGLEYDITEPLVYEDEVGNLFGGKPIKANAKIYFEDVDFEENYVVVRQELSLNPDDTKEMLKLMFTKMNLDEKKIEEGLKNSVIKVEDKNTFEYYFIPGIPHRIEAIRESLMEIGGEKGKRIDKTLIELIYYEED